MKKNMARFRVEGEKKMRLAMLCQQFQVQQLRLFGSAVTSDFDPEHSDLDFLVRFGPPPPNISPSTQFFDFKFELERLFERQVDLLEDHMIDNPYLRKNADAIAVTVYPANYSPRTAL